MYYTYIAKYEKITLLYNLLDIEKGDVCYIEIQSNIQKSYDF